MSRERRWVPGQEGTSVPRAVPAGSGKLELLHCPFPSAITHFPALGVVSSPPLQVNDFTGQQNLVRAVPG